MSCDPAGLPAEALQAQEELCKLPKRFRAIEERRSAKKSNRQRKPIEFSWIFNREVYV